MKLFNCSYLCLKMHEKHLSNHIGSKPFPLCSNNMIFCNATMISLTVYLSSSWCSKNLYINNNK